MSKTSLRVAIIGCGEIAGLAGRIQGIEVVRSHADAIARHEDFRLVAIVEPEDARRDVFGKTWNISSLLSSLDELWQTDVAIDLAVVSASTEAHPQILRLLSNANLRAVVCEKPVSLNVQTTANLVAAFEAKGIPLAVNYTRRWNVTFAEIAQQIASGHYGRLRGGMGCYTKGVYHNGSHIIDLCRILLGDEIGVEHVFPPSQFWENDDVICDFVLRQSDGARILISGITDPLVDIFDLHLQFDAISLAIVDFGRRVIVHSSDPADVPTRALSGTTENEIESAWPLALFELYDNVSRCIRLGGALNCNGRCALETEILCGQVHDRAASIAVR